MAAHKHHGADRVYSASRLQQTADMNITPMIMSVIDAGKGAGVEKVGIVTEGMRRAAAATSGL